MSNYNHKLPCDVFDAIEQLYRSLNISLNRHNSIGYTCGQGKMLRLLSENGASSQSELASKLSITASSASEIADKLIQSGFAVKMQDSADKRKSLLEITQSGKLEIERLKEEFTSFVNSAFSSLSSDELGTLLHLLTKVSSPADADTVQETVIVQPTIRRGTRL
ncbi:MAG: MarR family transcriptional regulator [Clostridia bacterium]|nr:MarR family transcriptional regulator [Clostridia bacterium]